MGRRMQYSSLVGLSVCAALGLCWLAGCGGKATYKGPQRAAVSGTVSLDDQPVTGGTITFKPLDAEGRTASAMIQDGRYDIPEEKGPNPGKYRVEITWDKPLGPPNEDNPDAPPPKSNQVIPAKYNKESTLDRDIESGKNELNFELTSS